MRHVSPGITGGASLVVKRAKIRPLMSIGNGITGIPHSALSLYIGHCGLVAVLPYEIFGLFLPLWKMWQNRLEMDYYHLLLNASEMVLGTPLLQWYMIYGCLWYFFNRNPSAAGLIDNGLMKSFFIKRSWGLGANRPLLYWFHFRSWNYPWRLMVKLIMPSRRLVGFTEFYVPGDSWLFVWCIRFGAWFQEP